VSIGDPDEINLKSGRQKPVRRLILADNSDEGGITIQVTFWGEISRRLNFNKGDVIAIKNIKVGDYNGKSLNVSDENHITTDFKGREREVLEKWASENLSKVSTMRCLTQIKEQFKPGQNIP